MKTVKNKNDVWFFKNNFFLHNINIKTTYYYYFLQNLNFVKNNNNKVKPNFFKKLPILSKVLNKKIVNFNFLLKNTKKLKLNFYKFFFYSLFEINMISKKKFFINFIYKNFFFRSSKNNIIFFTKKNNSFLFFNKNELFFEISKNNSFLLKNKKQKKLFPPFYNFFFTKFNYISYYNNYYPFLKKKDLSLFSKIILDKKKNNLLIFNIFNINFLEYFFKQKFFIKIKNNFYKKLLFKKITKSIIKIYSKKVFFFIDKKNTINLINLFIYSLYKKDLSFIFNFFIYFLEKTPISNHKQFIMFFKNIVVNNLFKYFPFFCIGGFFFDIRGKVGVTGNSKKRHVSFTAGSLKLSSKNVKNDYKHNIVKTVTGCLGTTMYLSFY